MKLLLQLTLAALTVFTGKKALAFYSDKIADQLDYKASLKIKGYKDKVFKVALNLKVDRIPLLPQSGITIDAPTIELFNENNELIASKHPKQGEKIRLTNPLNYNDVFEVPISEGFIRTVIKAGKSIQNILITIISRNQPLEEITLGIPLRVRVNFKNYRNTTFNINVEL